MLAFFLVPLSLGFNEQSSKVVQLLALGWGSESSATLNGYIPHLRQDIHDLKTNGLQFLTPEGVIKIIRINIEIAADMSSIWKATGIGSASAALTCLY